MTNAGISQSHLPNHGVWIYFCSVFYNDICKAPDINLIRTLVEQNRTIKYDIEYFDLQYTSRPTHPHWIITMLING